LSSGVGWVKKNVSDFWVGVLPSSKYMDFVLILDCFYLNLIFLSSINLVIYHVMRDAYVWERVNKKKQKGNNLGVVHVIRNAIFQDF
jgi:hypothetical protein